MQQRCATVLAILSACAAPPGAPETGALAIEHVNVVPVSRPGVLEDRTVVVDGGRILSVEPASRSVVPEGARRLDGRGRFLIPGLADMHEHLPRGGELEFPLDEYFDLLLSAGVTTIRSMRGAAGDPELRRDIEAGLREGPRLILGSPGIDGEIAPDPETARAAVRRYREMGFDFLKVLEGFDLETFEAIADEAKKQGLPIAGHLPDEVPMETALATFHSIEHLHGHAGAFRRDPVSFPELARATARSGVWICPTLGFQIGWYLAATMEEQAHWPGMEHATPAMRSEWTARLRERVTDDEEVLADRARRVEALRGCVRALRDAGVGLLVGSSGGYFLVPGYSLFVEARCLSDAGLRPEEILRGATLSAARSVGAEDEWGSIRPGLAADLVLLDANPLEDVRNLERVRAVVRRGVLHLEPGLR